MAALTLGAAPPLPLHYDSPLLGLRRHVYLHCTTWPPSANAALLPHPRLQTSYPPSAHSISSSSAPPPPSLAPASTPSDSLGVLQSNAGGLRARSTELLHFLSSHPVDLICIQKSNLNSSSSFRIPGFSALRSDRTHSRSGILSPDATHGEEIFDWVISSDLLPLNDPDTPTLLHRSSGSRFSPDISFAPSSIALSCSWKVLQDLGSNHLPILLSVPLSPAYCPNERPPSFNFQKARWDGFASYFDSHCPLAEEYSSLSLSSAAALFTSLALNAAKSSIPFGRIKALLKPGGLMRWKKRLVKNARLLLPLTEVMKIDRLTSPLLDAPRQSSPRPRLRHGRRFAFLFHLNLTLNLCTLFALSLALLPRLPPFLTFPTVLLPGNQLWFMPLTCDPTFPFLNQRLCVAEPEATFLSSAEPRAPWSLTRPFALLSLPAASNLQPCGCLQPCLVHCHWPRQSCLSHAKASSSLWHGFSSSHL